MSKLEKLIAELCPDGVEYKGLADICEIKTGKGITKKDIIGKGRFPIISGGIEPMGMYHLGNRLANTVTISRVGVNAGFVSYIDTDFYLNDKCFSVIPYDKYTTSLDRKFLYEYLKNIEDIITNMQSEGGVPTINIKKLSNIKIPIPPLPVQEEIVRILDTFTQLTAELKARKKQYEYYRDELICKKGHGVEEILLADIANYSSERISAKDVNEDNYIGVDNLLQDKKGKILSQHVVNKGSLTKYHPHDILIGNIRPYLRKIWFANNTGGANGDVLVIHVNSSKILPKYLYYNLSSERFFDYDNSKSKGGKMPRGDKESIMKYPMQLPSIQEQERIISILDRFDALCNDISNGIPAEIEARQKQYEYYRDKLLTFKKLA